MTWLFSRDTPQQLNLNTKGFATFQANTISISCVPHHPHRQVCFSNPYYSTGGHVIVTQEGFEPSTHSLEDCCSIQLSYRASLNCFHLIRTPGGIRTHNIYMTGSVDQGGHPITLYRRIYLYLYQIVNCLSIKLPCQVQINYTDIFSFKKYFEKNS